MKKKQLGFRTNQKNHVLGAVAKNNKSIFGTWAKRGSRQTYKIQYATESHFLTYIFIPRATAERRQVDAIAP